MKKSNVRSNANYYMHTSNALAPDYLPEEPEYRPSPKKGKVKVKKKHFVIASIPGLARVLLVFALALSLVGQYIYIQGLGYELNKTKNELTAICNNNEKLKEQSAALGDLKAVEAKAIYNLGMIKPENNVTYMPQSALEEAVALEEEEAQDTEVEDADFIEKTIVNVKEILRF